MAIIEKIREFLGRENGVIHILGAKVIHTDPIVLAESKARHAQCGSEVYAKDIIVGLDCGKVDISMCEDDKSESQIQQQEFEQIKK